LALGPLKKFAQDSIGHNWTRWIDTSLKAPDDISIWEEAMVVREAVYPVKPRSLVLLFARIKDY